MAETGPSEALKEEGNGVQYVIQGEDGSLHPFTGDPSQLMTAGGDAQAQYVEQEMGVSTEGAYIQENQSQVQYVMADGQHIEQGIEGSVGDQAQVQYVTSDGQPVQIANRESTQYVDQNGQIIQDPNLDIHQDNTQYVAADSQVNEDTGLQQGHQIQYVTPDGQPVGILNREDNGLINPGGEINTDSQLGDTYQDNSSYITDNGQVNEGVISEQGHQIQYVDENGMPVDPSLVNPDGTVSYTPETVTNTDSTVQYVDANGQPVQLNSEEQLYSNDVALDTSLSTTSAAFETSNVSVTSDSTNLAPIPTDQLPNTQETQFIMDPHTGTIYALKDGKATVLTTEANIIMDDPNALNLPTQTAKVVPGTVAVSNNNDTITTNNSNLLQIPVQSHVETANANSEVQTTEACATQTAGNSDSLTASQSAKDSPSPDPMIPPSGDLSLYPDIVSSTVSSEEPSTNSTITTTTVSSAVLQTSCATVASTAVTTAATAPSQSMPKTINAPSPKSPGKTVFKCELCDYRSASKGEVYQHLLLVHSPSKMMMCAKCKKGFRTKELCDAHQVNCGKPAVLQCKYCSFTSTSPDMIQSHVNDRHIPKPMLFCDQCSFTTRDPAALQKHKPTHMKAGNGKDAKKKVNHHQVVHKTIVPKVSTTSSPVREPITAQLAGVSNNGTPTQTDKVSSAVTPVKGASGKVRQDSPIRISQGSSPQPQMKRIVLAKHSRKEEHVVRKDLQDAVSEEKKTDKKVSPVSKAPIPKPVLEVQVEVHQSDDKKAYVICHQKDGKKAGVKKTDRKLQVNPKVCVSRVENFLELDDAVQLITQKKLTLTKAMKDAFVRKLHSVKHYARISKQIAANVTPQKLSNTTQLHQKQSGSAKVKPTNSDQPSRSSVDERKKDASSKKKFIQSMAKKQAKPEKPKMIKRKPSIMDKFFDDTREDYEESFGQSSTEGGRSKRKRKPKMFGHDFVNSEYLTASGVLSDVVSTPSSASLDENSVDDSMLDAEMEDEDENPYRKTYKKHPGSSAETQRKRKKSTGGRRKSKQDEEFDPEESESDEEGRPRKRTKYGQDDDFVPQPSKPKKTPKQNTESEDELAKLEAALTKGEKYEQVANEIINETALQESPVKKSLFLGETLHKEPKGRGRGRPRKASIEAPQRKQKKNMEPIRKPVGLEKKPVDQSEEDVEANVMVKYSEEDETEDEDSREALLRQYAAAVKGTTPTNESDGEEDPSKRKRKKKSYGDDFLTQNEKQSQELKVLGYMKRKVGRPPKEYKKPPKMKHTGSKNNPKRGPPPQPKYSIETTNSSTPSPTIVGQRRVDGMPSPNSEEKKPQSLPWVGKLSNILNQVQKGAGDGEASESPTPVKPTPNQGQLGGVRYTLMDKGGKLVMVPLTSNANMPKQVTSTANTPKQVSSSVTLVSSPVTQVSSPGTQVSSPVIRVSSAVSQGQSILKVAQSSSSSSSPSSSVVTAPTKVVVASKAGSAPVPAKVLSSLPDGSRIVRLNGKTFLCRTKTPATTTQSSPKTGVQKILVSPGASAATTKITSLDAVKSSPGSVANQIKVSNTASTSKSSIITIQGGNSQRVVKVSNSPKVVCLPPTTTSNVQFLQSSVANKTAVRRGRPPTKVTDIKSVPIIVKTMQPKLLPKPPQTITLFPSNRNPQLPSHVIPAETVPEPQNIETEVVSDIAIPTSVVAASQESARPLEKVAGAVELDPQDLLQNMTHTEEDIGTDMNQLPGFDSSDLLDPSMQEMLNLI